MDQYDNEVKRREKELEDKFLTVDSSLYENNRDYSSEFSSEFEESASSKISDKYRNEMYDEEYAAELTSDEVYDADDNSHRTGTILGVIALLVCGYTVFSYSLLLLILGVIIAIAALVKGGRALGFISLILAVVAFFHFFNFR